MRIWNPAHRLENGDTLGRGVTEVAERSNLIGIDGFGDLGFRFADEAAPAHTPRPFGHA
jgi:hypothetical protein